MTRRGCALITARGNIPGSENFFKKPLKAPLEAIELLIF